MNDLRNERDFAANFLASPCHITYSVHTGERSVPLIAASCRIEILRNFSCSPIGRNTIGPMAQLIQQQIRERTSDAMTIDEAVTITPADVSQNVECARQEYGTSSAGTQRSPLGLVRIAGGHAGMTLLMVGIAVALAVASWTSVAMAESEQACTELPSTAGYNDLGTAMEDRFDGIPGQETIFHGYLKGNELLVFASFVERDHPYAFWRENTQTGETFDTHIDLDNDCIFETYVEHGESDQRYDLQSWGFQ